MTPNVLIDEQKDSYQLTTEDGAEESLITEIGEPVILICSDGVYYCLLEDSEDEPEVFLVTAQTAVNSVTEDVTFIDNDSGDGANEVEVEATGPTD